MSQINLFHDTVEVESKNKNQILSEDLPIHRWYQFVLGYPPHLVKYYLEKFDIQQGNIVLDPFVAQARRMSSV